MSGIKSIDPIVRLAQLRIVRLSAELEVELSDKNGGGPALEMLRRLRDRAAESLAALALADLFTENGIKAAITLQNEVKRYDEWLVWMREIIAEGKAYDQQMQQDEREELLDLLTQTEEGQQEALALGLVDDLPRD